MGEHGMLPREPWLRALPIIRAMQRIDGYLYDDEADLLLTATVCAVMRFRRPYAVVEIGSYCGKSTVVLGMATKAIRPGVTVYAIDPHEGELSVADEVARVEPTLGRFMQNMEDAGVADVVVPINVRSTAVNWAKPISLLFIDALHDYDSVSQDFRHFAPWVVPRGYVAFHDYGKADFPGVTRFVDEVAGRGGFRPVERVEGLIVLEKVSLADTPVGTRRFAIGRQNRPKLERPIAPRRKDRAAGGDPEARAICIEIGPGVCPEGDLRASMETHD